MMDDSIRETAKRLAKSRIVPLDSELQGEIGSMTQDLIDRGLYNSSLLPSNAKGMGAQSLVKRAEIIADSIKEVCTAQSLGPAEDLADDLMRLFDDIYQEQQSSVQARVEKVAQGHIHKMVRIGRIQPDIEQYRIGLNLFADTLKHQKTESNFTRELITLTAVFLTILVGLVITANTVEWWMFPASLSMTLMAFIVIVAATLRRSGDLSERGFAKLILEIIKKVPPISSSSGVESGSPDESQDKM